MSSEFNHLADEVREAVGDDADLRERVRDVVVKALAERRWDPEAMREVMRQSVAGLGEGMGERGVQASEAMREAMQGLDEAMGRSVYALRQALDEAWGEGRRFAESDLNTTVEAIKGLEGDLLNTVKEGMGKTQGWAREAMGGFYEHMLRNGTDTGGEVSRVMETLTNRLAEAGHGVTGQVKEQAGVAQSRLADIASGFMRGMADALDMRKK